MHVMYIHNILLDQRRYNHRTTDIWFPIKTQKTKFESIININ